ncbi:MAG TPA: pseudouridine-5'-phosphate glycosidase [Candidatus Dormibacteraeota bacterium]|nr:pseudouridine-5'-phosphate glycosidase [Candidatus Dormibacteraeota bacterium]
MTRILHYSQEVERARATRTPIVALETTILSHGMPFPRNLETARDIERAVRGAGAVPATIAVLGGRIHVGLDDAQLAHIAQAPMLKAGRSDLAYALATNADAATTVAATVHCAALAGIAVFATGGIGGVHRGVAQTMDVSGDLDAIASSPVAVVCAGAKAILDLPKTLEALETRGVPVVGYRTSEFPAFWSRSSGLRLAQRLDTPAAVAALVRAQTALGLRSGIVVANPIAAEHEIPAAEMERYIADAVAAAAAARIGGKELSPWLLDRLLTSTAHKSLDANVALVLSNAALAAEIAIALAS